MEVWLPESNEGGISQVVSNALEIYGIVSLASLQALQLPTTYVVVQLVKILGHFDNAPLDC